MPTGIEEAGLVMAAFPLLVSLIDEYRQGLDLIKRWMKYKKTLRSLRRVLAAERQVFENACYKLFESVLNDDGKTARVLFSDRLGKAWKDPNTECKLKEGLGEESWNVFEGVMAEIQYILGKLLSELQRNIPIDRNTRLHSELIALSTRFNFVFGNKDSSLDELHRLIDIFQNLTKGVKIRRKEATRLETPKNYRIFRKKACDLCDAINQSFRCSCSTQHVANFRLGTLTETMLLLGESGLSLPGTDTFDIEFQSGKNWKAMAITPRPLFHNTSCHQINDLCVQLKDCQVTPTTATCLGYIGDAPPGVDKCYCVGPGVGFLSEDRSQVMSLHQVLLSERRHTRFPFYERDRLKLAIILATSLLGLHSTPWLQDMWTTRDILFRPFYGDLDEIALLQPYVAQSFPKLQPAVTMKPPPMVRNAALYALGKVLIQLVESRPLVDGQSFEMGGMTGDVSTDPEQRFAAELEPTIFRKAGKTWADVIRRCLYCEFDVDTSTAKLDNDEFFCRVYTMVISPLAEALQRMGKPL